MTADSVPAERPLGSRQRVAVDLISLDRFDCPVTPGLMQIRFMQGLTRHAPDVDFILLTRPAIDGALAHLDATNVRRLTIHDPSALESLIGRVLARVPGRRRRAWLAGRRGWSRHIRNVVSRWRPAVLARLNANVVFCPFTSSRVTDPSVPMVAAIHDLQHLSHPHLLTSAQRSARAREFDAISRRADRLVCSTRSLQNVALQSDGLAPERLHTVPPGRLLIPPPAAKRTIESTLARHGLRQDGFFLVAADLKPRHNHGLVLTAWGMLRGGHPQSDMKLVCAGGPEAPVVDLRIAAKRMGLEASVLFTGALARDELTALNQACRALIVPSLYETLGDIMLEAMAEGRPVLCSQVPDLVELAGEAALMFDPHRPTELAGALERVEHDPGLLAKLACRGSERVAMLDDAASVAHRYLAVFREAQSKHPL